jgi:hypothetical protein
MRRVAVVLVLVASCANPQKDCPEALTTGAVPGTASVGVLAVPSTAPARDSDESLLARATKGELSALKQLESLPLSERSIEQSAAIARGHSVLSKEAVTTFGRDLASRPQLLDDRNVLAQLMAYARDPVTADVALPVLARITQPVGPDMLYDVWKNDDHAPTQSLAEDLLGSRSVKGNSSKALKFVIALEREQPCEKLKELLEEDGKHADRRALPRLTALEKKGPCKKDGPADEDCWSCLREGDALTSVRARVDQQKKEPRKWEIRRR